MGSFTVLISTLKSTWLQIWKVFNLFREIGPKVCHCWPYYKVKITSHAVDVKNSFDVEMWRSSLSLFVCLSVSVSLSLSLSLSVQKCSGTRVTGSIYRLISSDTLFFLKLKALTMSIHFRESKQLKRGAVPVTGWSFSAGKTCRWCEFANSIWLHQRRTWERHNHVCRRVRSFSEEGGHTLRAKRLPCYGDLGTWHPGIFWKKEKQMEQSGAIWASKLSLSVVVLASRARL